MIHQDTVEAEGIWIMHEPESPPDIVVYYAHGKSREEEKKQ
jgi:hypothetical protein